MAKKEEAVKKENKTAKPKEKEFIVDSLISNSKKLTGYQPEVAAVALSNYKQDLITKAAFIKKVNDFVNTKVKDIKKGDE